jgi:hypothetical protein
MLFITALNIIAFACHHIIYSHCSFSFANRCCSRVLLAFSDANTFQWIIADSSQGQGRKMLLELVWVAACHQFFTVGSLVILVRWFEYYFYFIVPQLARWCLQVIHIFFFFSIWCKWLITLDCTALVTWSWPGVLIEEIHGLFC